MKFLNQIKESYHNYKEQSVLKQEWQNKCKENKVAAVSSQKEILATFSCPVCQNKEFFNNLYLYSYGYSHVENKVSYMNNNYANESSNTDAFAMHQRIEVNYRVCKKCGHILPFADMASMEEYNFRPDSQYSYEL